MFQIEPVPFDKCVVGLYDFLTQLVETLYRARGDLTSFLIQAKDPDLDKVGTRFYFHSMKARKRKVDELGDSWRKTVELLTFSRYPQLVKVAYMKYGSLVVDTLHAMNSKEIGSGSEYIKEAERQLEILNSMMGLELEFSKNISVLPLMGTEKYLGMSLRQFKKNIKPVEKRFDETRKLAENYNFLPAESEWVY